MGTDGDEVLHGRIAAEAMRFVEAAKSGSLTLRLTGSLAVRLHCPQTAPLLDAMGRRRPHDIDFWGYMREQTQLGRLFERDGYVADPTIKLAREWGVKRLIYSDPNAQVKIDVFMDELAMAHKIGFKGRLELDFPTVDLSDLLLSKLQIHDITANDYMDIIALLAEHEFGSGDRELIDSAHIVDTMKSDWGFYYTTINNIAKVEDALEGFSALPTEVVDAVHGRLGALGARIEAVPKTARWKLRARVGPRTRWYEDVGDVDR